MKNEVAEHLVEKTFVETSPQEREVLFVDTLGELTNMITGNATAIFNQKKSLRLRITTPVIATGENLNIKLVAKPTIILGLYSQYGLIEVSVALEEQDVLDELGEKENNLSEM